MPDLYSSSTPPVYLYLFVFVFFFVVFVVFVWFFFFFRPVFSFRGLVLIFVRPTNPLLSFFLFLSSQEICQMCPPFFFFFSKSRNIVIVFFLTFLDGVEPPLFFTCAKPFLFHNSPDL